MRSPFNCFHHLKFKFKWTVSRAFHSLSFSRESYKSKETLCKMADREGCETGMCTHAHSHTFFNDNTLRSNSFKRKQNSSQLIFLPSQPYLWKDCKLSLDSFNKYLLGIWHILAHPGAVRRQYWWLSVGRGRLERCSGSGFRERTIREILQEN